MKNIAIILASGKGKRTKTSIPKQFLEIKNKTILEYTVSTFENNSLIDEIVIVSNEEYIDKVSFLIKKNNFKKVVNIVKGGKERKDSSQNGINSIKEKEAKVLIHDCARPFVDDEIINKCIKCLDEYDAVGVAIPTSDTIIEINQDNIITSIPKRKFLKRIQTPQAFKLSIIKKAHQLASEDLNLEVTDDCGLILKYKLGDIFVVDGSEKNLKITYPVDVKIANFFLEEGKL